MCDNIISLVSFFNSIGVKYVCLNNLLTLIHIIDTYIYIDNSKKKLSVTNAKIFTDIRILGEVFITLISHY